MELTTRVQGGGVDNFAISAETSFQKEYERKWACLSCGSPRNAMMTKVRPESFCCVVASLAPQYRDKECNLHFILYRPELKRSVTGYNPLSR
ncbi:hypothetical protein RRG08_059119 [Elysia crispata]|uniref:Uncharacterized protein n=1 Tax=Elysia crispata TaxID=231223 RepID=A0AAE1CPC9_9GAST|nr:hypothetical protein RRG08_059119 [Elysia crispata]